MLYGDIPYTQAPASGHGGGMIPFMIRKKRFFLGSLASWIARTTELIPFFQQEQAL